MGMRNWAQVTLSIWMFAFAGNAAAENYFCERKFFASGYPFAVPLSLNDFLLKINGNKIEWGRSGRQKQVLPIIENRENYLVAEKIIAGEYGSTQKIYFNKTNGHFSYTWTMAMSVTVSQAVCKKF